MIRKKVYRGDISEDQVLRMAEDLVMAAVEDGELKMSPEGTFRLGEVAKWATSKWPGRFDHLLHLVEHGEDG